MDQAEKIQNDALQNAIETIKNETVTDVAIVELRDTYSPQIITDGASLKFMVEGAKTIKKHMSTIEKRRKELTAPAIKFQKELKKQTDGWRSELESIHTEMSSKIKDFEDKEKAEKIKVFNQRCDELIQSGFDLVGGFYVCGMLRLDPDEMQGWNDDDFEFYKKKGIDEKARRDAEQKRLDDERKAIQKEREELAAQKLALEKQYGHLIEDEKDPEPEIVVPEPEPVRGDKNEIYFNDEKFSENNKPDFSELPTPLETVETALNELDVMEKGFDVFRAEFLKLMASPEKFNRKILIDWAENLKFDDVCLEKEN